MNVYETARLSIKGVLKSLGLKQANERVLKKSAFCTTWIISDGDVEVEDYDFCQNQHTWQPEIDILLHNGANREALYDSVNKTRYNIITALINYGKFNRPADIFQFGVPVESEQIEIDDNTVRLTIRLTCIAQIED